MVVVRNRTVEKRPMKPDQETSFAHRAQAIESIKNALVPLGIDDRQSFQVTFEANGNVTVHPSIQDLQRGQQAVALNSHNQRPSAGIEDENDEDVLRFNGATPSRPRVKRAIRVRGRSRQPANHLAAPFPSPVPTKQPEQLDVEEDMDPVRPQTHSKSFRIDDTEKVVAFLGSRLKRMQQLADKKIAKAWIRGICPKKQAWFPYRNNKRKEQFGQEPEVPGWWPDLSVCEFTEPDHIRREERMNLCLHLLRLRPSPEELKAWNHDKSEPHRIHRTEGWTAFLEDLAGPEIFEDLPREDKKRTQRRQELLRQMYEVAKMEEEYEIGGIDGSDRYTWEEDEEDRRILPAKRSHQTSVMSMESSQSRSSSVSATENRAKRPRTGSFSSAPNGGLPQAEENMMEDLRASDQTDSVIPHGGPSDHPRGHLHPHGQATDTAHSQSRPNNPFVGEFEVVPMKRESSRDDSTRGQPWPWHSSGQWLDHPHPQPHPYASSQAPQQLDDSRRYGAPSQIATSSFPDRQNYEFPASQPMPQTIQCHKVDHVPEPELHSLPTTPIFSPIDMPMPLSSFVVPNCEIPQDPSYCTTMPPAQYFMPAHSQPSEFQPAASASFSGYPVQQMAERHMVPVQYHGRPFTQPAACHEHRFPSHNPT